MTSNFTSMFVVNPLRLSASWILHRRAVRTSIGNVELTSLELRHMIVHVCCTSSTTLLYIPPCSFYSSTHHDIANSQPSRLCHLRNSAYCNIRETTGSNQINQTNLTTKRKAGHATADNALVNQVLKKTKTVHISTRTFSIHRRRTACSIRELAKELS